MKTEIIYQPPITIIAKPKYGNPCNGCGWCCHSQVCYLGQEAFKITAEQTPCPAMMYTDNKVRCGLVVAEKSAGWSPMLHDALGVGKGCDSDSLEGWENE